MPQKRILVVGAGSIGERHVRCFQRTGRADVWLCEINADLCAAVSSRYGLSKSFTDFEAALAAAPEAAVICTPAHLHVAMALRLAEAGIHILTEKPVSTSLDNLDRLEETIARRGILTGVAYVYRAHPVLTAMRQALQEGRFGKPVQLAAVSGQHFPHYRPAYREIYYRDRATGGGAVQDALTHTINAAEWLIGPVTSLAADAAHQVLEGVDVEDTVNVIGRHGPVLASYSMNQHQAPNENTMTVVCEKGTAHFEAHQNRWRWMTAPEQPWQNEEHPALERDTLFVRQADAFLDALEGKAPLLCPLKEGVQTLKVNLAILAAADTRTWQEISP